MSVVDALTKSTRAYLQWMDQQNTVTIGARVSEIAITDEDIAIEGELWISD
jgi:hypothetical protein